MLSSRKIYCLNSERADSIWLMRNANYFPDFHVRLCYGHTPGLMIPVIRYNDKTLVYTGDLIPTAAISRLSGI